MHEERKVVTSLVILPLGWGIVIFSFRVSVLLVQTFYKFPNHYMYHVGVYYYGGEHHIIVLNSSSTPLWSPHLMFSVPCFHKRDSIHAIGFLGSDGISAFWIHGSVPLAKQYLGVGSGSSMEWRYGSSVKSSFYVDPLLGFDDTKHSEP